MTDIIFRGRNKYTLVSAARVRQGSNLWLIGSSLLVSENLLPSPITNREVKEK
jgi:hypothetical protein